jgi:hypothetical protein
MGVEYRDVVGALGYRVGNDGSVWSCLKQAGYSRRYVMTTEWHPLKLNTADGYPSVKIRGRRRKVHRLVLEAFVGPCPDGMEGCHWNGTPTDCRLDNLRWDTHKGNGADSIRHGVHKGTRNGRALFSESVVDDIRKRITTGERQADIAREFSVSRCTVNAIAKGRRWEWLPAQDKTPIQTI